MANLKNTVVTSADNLQLPSGSTSQRPVVPQEGMLRYNTDKGWPEQYRNTGWSPIRILSGLKYTLFDTQVYVTANDHPSSTQEMDEFFDESNAGINLLAEGVYAREINWGMESQVGAGGLVMPSPTIIPADYIAWKVEGYIYAPETGIYTIGCDSDDSSDIFVDGVLTANWYGGHGFDGAWQNGSHANTANHFVGQVSLIGGNYYSFVARMEERTGGAGLQVGWQKPSDSEISLIPSAYFFRKV